jgi:hypothetical protein
MWHTDRKRDKVGMIMEELMDSTCIICKESKQDGIRICMQFICADCEKEMIHTDVKDAKYPFFINQMKQIWYRKNA